MWNALESPLRCAQDATRQLGVKLLRENAPERKGKATVPAIASERATALLVLIFMPCIISNLDCIAQWRIVE